MSGSRVTVVCSPEAVAVRPVLAVHLAAPDGLLVDFGTPCGSLDVLLDLQPTKTWADLLPVASELTAELLARATTPCPGIGALLAAPPGVAAPSPALVAAVLERARDRGCPVVVEMALTAG